MNRRIFAQLRTLAVAAVVVFSTLPTSASTPAKTAPSAGDPKVTVLATSSPLVSFRILVRTGSVDDPAGKEGLAALTASAIGEGGTKDHSYSELVELLHPMAASLGARCDKEVTVFTGVVHRDHLERFWSIAKGLLFEPRFDPADFARVKTDAGNYLVNTLRGTDDEGLGKWTFQVALYSGHPYGHVDGGTVNGVNSITLDDVKAFRASHYTRDRVVIGLAGSVPAGFAKKVAADFRRWPASGPAPAAIAEAKIRPGRRVTIVEKEARATAISWGFPLSLTRKDDDFFALMVANSYLGEHRTFNGMLMKELRGVRGLNYGDYSYIENFVQDGGSTFPVPNVPRSRQAFSVWIRPVRPDNAPFALRASLHHFDKLVRDGIPEAAFRETRDFLLGYSRLWAQSTSRRLGYKLDSEWYGRADFLAEIQKRLPKLTKADVDRAVRKYLSSADLEIAIVSKDAAKLADLLASGAPTPIHYDTEGTPAAVLEEDKLIEAWPLGIAKENIRIVAVAEMFAK